MTKLYGALLLSVLLISGCGEAEDSAPDPSLRGSDSEQVAPPDATGRVGTILFIGNSLAAGLGVRREEAFPSLIQDKIDSLGWNYQVVNAGISGDTSSGGVQRVDWLLRDTVDVIVLELGANDGLRGISPAAMRENLATIIDRARARYPDIKILLAGMKMPPNLGRDYTRAFEEAYFDLAAEKEVQLIPFLLDGVGGVAALNQGDGVHPTAGGHEIIAETVWRYLKPILAGTSYASTSV